MGEPAIRERIAASSGWHVSRQLGRGQYGTAYLVSWDEQKCGEERKGKYQQGEQAVAKVVGLEFLPEKEHNLAFQEVELMRNLRHPHIVALRDHFLTEASLELCIVMEFCDSGDLRGEVKVRTQAKPVSLIPESQIMTWFVQMTLALNHMHQRHILHRDLKSSNIFLTANASNGYDVRIGDFGISRVLEGTVDVAATVVGTPYYMSPEVCKAEPYGYKSDIWALGCVLYEMCMLKHAFESQSLLGLVYKIVSETYEPIPPQYSADLRTLIDDILEKSSSKRPSGLELLARAYVRRFDVNGQAEKDAKAALSGDQVLGSMPEEDKAPDAAASDAPAATAPVAKTRPSPSLANKVGAQRENMRTVEPSPAQPSTAFEQEQAPVRREWHAPPFAGAAGPTAAPASASKTVVDGDFRAKVLLSRVRRALSARRQNWLQVFASFDHLGDGQLKEAEFERAVTSMALGLSDQEIREVRAYLQSASGCVPVDLFGNALHRVSPEVLQFEDWGRAVLGDLAREASGAEDANKHGVFPGAHVRVRGLQSATGAKLNGSEGVVESWNAATCRWNVRFKSPNGTKSIRDEHLEPLGQSAAPPPSSTSGGNGPDTIALYRLLCQDGATAAAESSFGTVLQRLLPQTSEEDRRRLYLLLPKCPDGKIDVPEALSQLEKGFSAGDQTLHLGATLAGGLGRGGGSPTKLLPGPQHVGHPVGSRPTPHWGTPMKPTPSMPNPMSPISPARVPGAVGSPRGVNSTPGVAMSTPGPAMSPGMSPAMSPGPSMGGSSPAAQAAMLRLAQRLLGRQRAPGPGVEVLRLFASRADSLSLEEAMEAVSVLPLGISRAEVQIVFSYVRGPGATVLTFSQLSSATDAAYNAGVPVEAAGMDFKRLGPALQRLEANGGRASPQEFRVALMQAEPYMTHSQMEWLALLTDKDGEGRLLPGTLLLRLGVTSAAAATRATNPLRRDNVPARPVSNSMRAFVASGAPQVLVVSAALGRVRQRLFRAGPQLTLGSILSLFDIADGSNRQQAESASVSRELLAVLLGHLRLGISVAEADELVAALAASGRRNRDSDTVGIVLLYDFVDRAGETDMEALVTELRDTAQRRLLGKASLIVAHRSGASDWLSEAEFRRGLRAALAESCWDRGSNAESEEDQLLLLADKNAAGHILWRPFVQAYCGWPDIDQISEVAVGEPQSLHQEPPSPAAARRAKPTGAAMGTSTQSWRAGKAAQRNEANGMAGTPIRSVVAPPSAKGGYPEAPLSPSPQQTKGFCCLRRRCKT
eukprot:TRINITY_DN31477_c0_g1_i1.p1 TRINITY_DN31477_c0_g1~~TRINITY_DN31477_c0_g1_i1.p1  ORF type:complete len:1272 (-),score=235.41 TRINITY_DN31477_c0_g1_i1:38-3853(-)